MTRRPLTPNSRPLSRGDYVFGPSELAGGATGAYVHEIDLEGGFALVRLDLDENNEAMRAAMADSGLSADQVELMDLMPLSDIEFPTGARIDVARMLTEQARTRRALAEQARRNRIAAIRASGQRLALPDLDAGLRTQERTAR